ncbi:MAG TPA: hypothetical protein VGJ15_03540 [Pirellulales bacterium]|jgi:hypothetical protein
MSDRERWIVYPLLFLAIGLAMNSNIERQVASQENRSTDADIVKCKTLEIIGPEGSSNPQARLSAGPSGAMLSLFDRDGQSVIRLGHDEGLCKLIAKASNKGEISNLPLFGGPLVPLPLLKPKGIQPLHKQSTQPPAKEESKPEQPD